MAPDGTTTRVELPSGGWAEVRTRITVGDLKAQRRMAHERGYQDEALDSIGLFPRMIAEWSLGDVSEATIDEMDALDAVTLIQVIAGRVDPNLSAPSSIGGGRKTRKARVVAHQ